MTILTHKGKPLTYAYELGCHLPTGKLCRIFHRSLSLGNIPINCVRVIKYRERLGSWWYKSLDDDGNLDMRYWSLPRDIDLDRR